MATISFRLRKTSQDKHPILVRLSMGRGKEYQSKTGFTINPKDWNEESRLPKGNNEDNKRLRNDLKTLDAYIDNNVNKSLGKGEMIDKYWLDAQINGCFNRKDKKDSSLLTNHIKYIIANANTRKIKGTNKIGLSKGRVRSYNTFLNLIERYQKEKLKKDIHFLDINQPFVEKLTNWLLNELGLSVNYSGKVLANLKAVCNDAERNLIEVNEYAKNIEVFKEKKEDRIIQILSFDELELLKSISLEGAKDNARNWLVLGCYLGQRVGDLMKINKNNIRLEQNYLFVDLTQEKTGKGVTIPIYDDYSRNILLNKLPYPIEPQKFNNHIKSVCKLAGITQEVQGKKTNPKTKRKELGVYPKYELITSHCMRRSFASNHYGKMATPLIIGITGHSREDEFLKYIGVPEDKDYNAKEFLRQLEKYNKANKTKSNLKSV
ncbi:MAG: phage integrase SAM-like domain-containing protein [Flavobacteriales bacterium]|nr:phage integrase SAM-like domain-containing protein [Flavobacteriales bacterium]